MRKTYPYYEFFWSTFSGIWTEYGYLRSKPLYSVRIRENTGQKNSEYGHFLHSDMNYATELSTAYHAISEWHRKVTFDFTEIINERKSRQRTVSQITNYFLPFF